MPHDRPAKVAGWLLAAGQLLCTGPQGSLSAAATQHGSATYHTCACFGGSRPVSTQTDWHNSNMQNRVW